MNPTIHVLVIDIGNHGLRISAHKTRESADIELYAYVKEYWAALPDHCGTCPDDRDEAIATYFGNIEDDMATIEAVEVEG